MRFDTHLLDKLSATYPTHVAYLKDELLPSISDVLAKTLKVVPANTIEVPLGSTSRCALEMNTLFGLDLGDLSGDSGDGDFFEMGADGDSLIYNDVDLVVIIIPVEGTFVCPEGQDPNVGTLAFATNCQHDQWDRPTVGYSGVCFGPLQPSDRSPKTNERRMLTMMHELTHVLGFNSQDIPFFYDHASGKPRTPRDQWNRPLAKEVQCVDGTRQTVLAPSEDTLQATTTANGYIAYEIVTETVKTVARNQFDCQTLVGGRLENQPTAEDDCFGSHWDQVSYSASLNSGKLPLFRV